MVCGAVVLTLEGFWDPHLFSVVFYEDYTSFPLALHWGSHVYVYVDFFLMFDFRFI